MVNKFIRGRAGGRISSLLLGLLSVVALSPAAWAIRAPDSHSTLQPKAAYFVHAPELNVHPSIGASQSLMRLVSSNSAVAAFVKRYPGEWNVTWDSRSDRPNMVVGSGIALIPGRGNSLSRSSLGLAPNEPMDLATVGTLLEGFIKQNADLLKTQGLEFKIDAKSAQPFGRDKSHWFVDFQQVKGGVPVHGAHLFFRIAAGNIVQFGSYLVAPVTIDTHPASKVGAAFAKVFAALKFPSGTKVVAWLDRGSLSIRVMNPTGAAMRGQQFSGIAGTGYAHKLVWRFAFRVDADRTTYQVLVDAHNDNVIDVRDINDYATATVDGGVFAAGQPNTGTESIVPFPYVAVSNGGNKTTDANGTYDWSGAAASTALNGKYISISDNCGDPTLSDSVDGNLHLGTSSGTDCTKPANASSTHSARNAFYYLTQINRKAASYYPTNTWLNGKVTANVNIDDTCNAYWDGTALNFFKSGGGCANTGELSGVFMHEFGHGIQENVAGQSPNDYGTGEATGDTFAFLQTHDGCIGNGFLLGSAASCTGVRDVSEYSAHDSAGFVVTPANITASGGPDCDNGLSCPYLTPQGQPYQGPMGYEGHCESYIASSANWDLARALTDAMGDTAGWQKMDDLWYGILPDNTDAYQVASGGTCNTGATVNGCASNNWYNLYLAADDDDGNLANGTPNACRIWDAFNAHGIACGTRPVCSTAQPGFTLSLTPASNAVCAPGDSSYTVNTVALGQPPLSNNITLQATGLPAGASANFVPNPVAPGSSSTLTVSVDGTVASGDIAFNVAGQASGADDQTTSGSLSVSNGVPVAPVLALPTDAATGVSPNASLSWNASAGATTYNVDVASDAAFANIVQTQTNIAGLNASFNLAASSTYYWRVAGNSTCATGAYSSAFSFTTGNFPFPSPYCLVTFTAGVEPITHVTFAGIDNASAATSGDELEDFTSIVGNVIAGQSLPISVQGNTVGNYTDNIDVFVDWNHNGVFTDTGEKYVLSDLINSTGADGKQSTGTIAVPAGAAPGSTRMRVMKRFGGVSDPCNTDSYGQAEDYTLTVVGAPVIGVNPTSLSATLAANANTTQTLTIANSGQSDLIWSIDEAAATIAAVSQRASAHVTSSQASFVRNWLNAPLAETIQDGGFELGTPNAYWDEASQNFGTILCNSSCLNPATNAARSGDWWAFFGGIDAAEVGHLYQDVTIPTGTASLSFWLEIPASSGLAGDFIAVSIDSTELFRVTGDNTTAYTTAYQQVTLDVSAFADGGVHTVKFDSTVLGGGAGGNTNIFVDDVSLDAQPPATNCSTPSDLPWLSVSPTSGTTAVSGSTDVTVTYDATGLSPATYTGKLCVNNNDPATPRVEVPVSLTVTAAPVTHTVTPSVATGSPSGTISPDTAQTVNDGSTALFGLSPAVGYHSESVGGTCGGTISGSSFTTSAVTANCTVEAHFAANVLVFTTQPADVTQTGALSTVVVSEQDGQGNAITNDSLSTVNFSMTVCGGSLDLGSATMANGVATLNSNQPFFTVASGLVIHAASSGALNASTDSAGFSVLANTTELVFDNGFESCRP